MDVVLGVAVTGRVARLAMIGSPDSSGQVFDQYALDLTDDAATDLAETIVGTYRAVAESGNRLAATRLCLPDASEAETLRQTVSNAGVQNVEVVTKPRRPQRWPAVSARTPRYCWPTTTPSRWRWSARTRSRRRYWRRCPSARPVRPSRAPLCWSRCRSPPPGSCWSGSAWTSIRLRPSSVRRCRWRCRRIRASRSREVPRRRPIILGSPGGRGDADGAASDATAAPVSDATQMGPAACRRDADGAGRADATQMAPAADRRQSGRCWPTRRTSRTTTRCPRSRSRSSFPEQEDEATYTAVIAPPPPRTLLVGSAMAFLVMSFTTLAVAVAVNIRPVADVEAQPVPPVQSDTVPGRYLPQVPHEPDPVALPIAVVSPAPAAPAAPRVRINQGPATNNVPAAPAQRAGPQAPPPGPAPAPEVPLVPIPPVIFFRH